MYSNVTNMRNKVGLITFLLLLLSGNNLSGNDNIKVLINTTLKRGDPRMYNVFLTFLFFKMGKHFQIYLIVMCNDFLGI